MLNTLTTENLIVSDLEKQPIPPLSPEEALHYVAIIETATENFRVQADELQTAIGMLMTGRLLGWKVLLIMILHLLPIT